MRFRSRRDSQVGLRLHPVVRVGLAGSYLKHLLVVGDGLLQVLDPLTADTVTVGVCQVVLGYRPFFRMGLLRVYLRCLANMLDSLFKVFCPITTNAIAVSFSQF